MCCDDLKHMSKAEMTVLKKFKPSTSLLVGVLLVLVPAAGSAGQLPSRISAIDSLRYVSGEGPACHLILVQAGEFVMGDGSSRGGETMAPVTLTRDFYLGQYEVTNREFVEMAQWAYENGHVIADDYAIIDWLGGEETVLAVLDRQWTEIAYAHGRFSWRPALSPHAEDTFPAGYDPADHPVKDVTWAGSLAFCDWLNLRAGLPLTYDHASWECIGGDPYAVVGYRLATDAEWEHAARFPDGRTHPWGSEPCDCSRANYDRACGGWTTPVGSYPGAPEIGGHRIYDLVGNLWERVHDWWWEIPDGVPLVDPFGPSQARFRVLRGGAWWPFASDLPCALRPQFIPDYQGGHVGFRVARTAGSRLQTPPASQVPNRWQ
jgi:formylglycine-generating enzyme required for sulfatase activity